MDPIRFGIVMVLNMCIGICTPPVGSVLFVGCSVSKLPINKIIKPMLPFYAVMVLVLAMVAYIRKSVWHCKSTGLLMRIHWRHLPPCS